MHKNLIILHNFTPFKCFTELKKKQNSDSGPHYTVSINIKHLAPPCGQFIQNVVHLKHLGNVLNIMMRKCSQGK